MNQPSASPPRTGLPAWVILGWPLVVAVATVYVLEQRTAARLAEAAAARPPVAVLDELAFVQKYGSAQGGMSAAATTAAALRAQGYLVLDRGQVIEAPPSVEVRP